MKKVLMTTNKKISEPFLDYLHSGESQFNWFISYDDNKNIQYDLIFKSQKQEDLPSSKTLFNTNQRSKIYDTKNQLRFQLRKLDSFQYYSLKSTDFFPESYLLNYNSKQFSREEKQFLNLHSPKGQFWIEKPVNQANGKGILIHDDIEIVKKEIEESKLKFSQKQNQNKQNEQGEFKKNQEEKQYLIEMQRYINNPLLIDGKKCDMRYHVTQFYTGSYWMIFLHDSYMRCTLDNYSNDTTDKLIHTTHNHYTEQNRKHLSEEEYNERISRIQITAQQFKQKYMEQYNKTQKEIDEIYQKVKEIITYTFLSCQNVTPKHKGFYHIYGVDVMIDDNDNPWLWEINYFPAIHVWTPAKEISMKSLAKSNIDLLMQFQDDWDNMDQLAQNPEKLNLGDLEIIYNEGNNFSVLNHLQTKKGDQNKNKQQQQQKKEEL